MATVEDTKQKPVIDDPEIEAFIHRKKDLEVDKLFRALVIPGCIGAVLGATLAYFGQKYAIYVRIPLSMYTVYLGYYILRKAYARKNLKNITSTRN